MRSETALMLRPRAYKLYVCNGCTNADGETERSNASGVMTLVEANHKTDRKLLSNQFSLFLERIIRTSIKVYEPSNELGRGEEGVESRATTPAH